VRVHGLALGLKITSPLVSPAAALLDSPLGVDEFHPGLFERAADRLIIGPG